MINKSHYLAQPNHVDIAHTSNYSETFANEILVVGLGC